MHRAQTAEPAIEGARAAPRGTDRRLPPHDLRRNGDGRRAEARARFTKKWRLRCPAVVESLAEAGDELFTFLRFPSSQWKALRTTNALERINEEFRRRTKTQASLPGQDAVLLLLFGLLRSGQVKLRALVNELVEAKHAMQLARVLARWTRYDVIAIDEVGYVPLADVGAELLFQIIADRTERAALILTTNLPFSEWTQVIPNARLCKAVLDRITDRAHIIDTGHESYRFRRTLEKRQKKG